jgi:shikimate dehydrogenase
MIKLGLIGHNITNSQAPDIHQRLGSLFGISIRYELFDIKDKEENYFYSLLKELKTKDFKGVNITFPFKEKAINYADQVNDGASYVKSANTLIFQKKIVAYNTDYSGFLKTLDFHFKDHKAEKILVIGGGGVGRSILFGLGSLGKKEIYLLEANLFKGVNLVKELSLSDINCQLIQSDQLATMIESFDAIINCTPIGHKDFPGCPLGLLQPCKNQWLFDAVYTPAKTLFIKKGEKVGAKIISGIDLFLFQALDAFILFNNGKVKKEEINNHIIHLRQYYFKNLFI